MKKTLLAVGITLAGMFFLTGQTGLNGDPRKGKVIFEKYCSSCHGKKGAGLGPGARMPVFTDKKYQDSKTDQELFNKITSGGNGSGMPAWEKSLSLQDRWNVVSFIRSLGPN
ncbi:MAG: cytochrome c [Nitrospirae bacterium]|nr:cytochrome c [Nitrospirota bacterium]